MARRESLRSDRRQRAKRLTLVGVVVLVVLLGLTLPRPAGVGHAPNGPAAIFNPDIPYNPAAAHARAPVSTIGLAGLLHARPALPAGFPVPPGPFNPLSNVPINAARFLNDTSFLPQSETSVAVDPTNTNNVLGGVNDARAFFCAPAFGGNASYCTSGWTLSLSGFTLSTNGGTSIAQSADIPGQNNTVVPGTFLASFGDPAVAAAPGHVFYYASLIIAPIGVFANGIELAVNTSALYGAGSCWTYATTPYTNPCWKTKFVYGDRPAVNGTFEDKELLAVDWDASSAYYGQVYVAWDHFNANGTSNAFLERCTEALVCTLLSGGPTGGGISTWANPYIAFSTPAVGPDGSVYVSFCNFGNATLSVPLNCSVVKSPAGGTAFGAPVQVTSFGGPRAPAAFRSWYPFAGYATEQFRTSPVDSLAVGSGGNVYFTVPICTTFFYYVLGPSPGDCQSVSTVFSHSSNGGTTWSTPAILTGNVNTIQPSVTVDPTNGNVVVTYASTQFDPFDHKTDVMAAVSTNQGTTWNTYRLTNTSDEPNSDPAFYFSGGAGFGGSWIVPQYGDYFLATAYGGQIWTTITGSYDVSGGIYNADMFLGRMAETGPIVVTPTVESTPADAGKSIHFNATAANALGPVTYSWAFGDGTSGSGVALNHTYALPGNYSVTVTGTEGAWGSASKTVSVSVNPALSVSAVVAPSIPKAGETATFVAATNGGSGGATYAWTFGDGGTGAGATPTHTYSASGTYTATVTANDTLGGSAKISITVVVGAAPAATVTATSATEYTILALIGGLVVGALVMWAVMRRRRGPPVASTTAPMPAWQEGPTSEIPAGPQGQPPGPSGQPPGPGA